MLLDFQKKKIYVYMDLMKEFELIKRVVKFGIVIDFKINFIILYVVLNKLCKEFYEQELEDVL